MLADDSIHSMAIDKLAAEYGSTLQTYLAGGGEEALERAYEIGREALLDGLGILDMVELHRQAVKALLNRVPSGEIARRQKDALVFFGESLSPFEITHRGYRDAVEVMHRVTDFASLACHEVKIPLSSILSSAGMLEEMLRVDRRSPQHKLLRNMLKGVAVLKSRTDDLLDVAGFYSGKLRVRVKPVDVAEFLRQVCDHLEPLAKSRGMKLNLEMASHLPVVEIDPDRLEQVVANLVQNALKYAAEGGRVNVRAVARTNWLIIEVQDHGRGILPYEQILTDKPFDQEKLAVRGTGLGLILCNQIVEAHHGKIILKSMPGKGSTFQILLPLAGAHHRAEAEIESLNR